VNDSCHRSSIACCERSRTFSIGSLGVNMTDV
jgi:hypothetical protein